MKSQKGIALLSVILAATIVFTGGELALLAYFKKHPRQATQPQSWSNQDFQNQKETAASPQPSSEQDSKKQKELDQQLSKLTEQINRWTGKGGSKQSEIEQRIQDQIDKNLAQQEPLLNVLPPKERAELEDAIRQAQEVKRNIKPYNPSDSFDRKNILKSLDEINKQTREQVKQQTGGQPVPNTGVDFDIAHIPAPATIPQPSGPTPEEIAAYYQWQQEQAQNPAIPGVPPIPGQLPVPQPPPVYLNPLNNPAINPMANPAINPVMNPAVNPMANPQINPMANPAINPGCIPCQFSR